MSTIDPTETGIGRCYRHPMRETGVRCIRCNRPICPDCMRPASVGFQCPDDVNAGARTIRRVRTVVGAPVQATAYVTWTLATLNVVVYLAGVAGSRQHDLNDPRSSRLFRDWDLVPYLVAHGGGLPRLLTSAFLHLSLTHLILNMVALGVVGPFVEREIGWWRYLATYLLAALGGSVLVYAGGDHLNAVAGASGAIYGLFAASLVLARRLGLDMRALLVTIAVNFIFTFSVPGISIEGHVGGFVVGGIAALAIVGRPWKAERIRVPIQAVSLGALLLLLVVIIAVRTATYPTT